MPSCLNWYLKILTQPTRGAVQQVGIWRWEVQDFWHGRPRYHQSIHRWIMMSKFYFNLDILKMILHVKVRDFATYIALEANGQGEFLVIIFTAFCHDSHHWIFLSYQHHHSKCYLQVRMEVWHLRLFIRSQTTQASVSGAKCIRKCDSKCSRKCDA